MAASTSTNIETNPLRWTWQRWHFLLFLVGLLLRLGFCLLVNKETAIGEGDGKEFFGYAQSLLALQGDNYPRFFTSIRPPFYPIFLMPFVAVNDQIVWHIQLAQSLIGCFQAFVLAKIAGRWCGQRAGNWAFVLALLHPFLIYYCAYVLTETLFIALLWSGIACLQRLDEPPLKNPGRWLILGGIALGLACLTRPTLQPFLVVAVFWLGWRMWRIGGWTTALKRMAYFTGVVSLLLLPFMIRNLRVHGDFSLAPGGGPAMYAMSNSPDYLRMYEAKTKEEYYEVFGRLVIHYSVKGETPVEVYLEEARDFRQNHSADWWRLQWYKFKHFWTPWLNPLIFPRSLYLLSLVATTPLFLLAAIELWRRRRKMSDPFLVLLLGLVAVGYIVGGFLFHVQVRYRIPFIDVAFLLLTASFLGHFSFGKLMAWRRPQLSEEAA
jgi:4-amino-4-deoxy-L-arabinose transferase-like glycosyltransferase